MAQRDRLIQACSDLLEGDEQVASVIKALEGPNRWIGMAVALLVAFALGLLVAFPLAALPAFLLVFQRLYAKRLVLATDRAVVVVGCGRWLWRPLVSLDRLPVDTRISPLQGLWLETRLHGRRLFVQPRWIKEVAAADGDLSEE